VLVLTVLLGSLTDRLVGNRTRLREEAAGLDLSQHGESAYEIQPVQSPAPVPAVVPVSPAGFDGRTRPAIRG
jgi:hypothetical protein